MPIIPPDATTFRGEPAVSTPPLNASAVHEPVEPHFTHTTPTDTLPIQIDGGRDALEAYAVIALPAVTVVPLIDTELHCTAVPTR